MENVLNCFCSWVLVSLSALPKSSERMLIESAAIFLRIFCAIRGDFAEIVCENSRVSRVDSALILGAIDAHRSQKLRKTGMSAL